ncbi:hypothetical protein S40285_02034 [Stachybotrys chlorohalonatus IBT 40285]|uniref:Mediator complex subunit 15 KIX domain-containing protein n=1 Tax=Stachybotrys chlorohalonatus (strain IBT 40285) TaxID=1283841 RepID=A0A084R194_STAC4|nr:hypothetical protein S40285_02034 [Stachybotrys chlorohalonata IBT 40285]
MQQMAAPGQIMPQQLRKQQSNQLGAVVYQSLLQQPPSNQQHDLGISLHERMGKTMSLISNIALAQGMEPARAADFGLSFERDVLMKAASKEMYEQVMNNKMMEFVKKRQANEPNLQNSLNAGAQAQAQVQAQAQQRAMMNMQQLGRGMGQGPQGFPQFQQPMPGAQMPQQQQMQQNPQQNPQHHLLQQQQQMGMPMGNHMGMGMVTQAGRGAGPNSQAMNMGGGQGRPPQPNATDISRLTLADKQKVQETANRMMASTPESQKNQLRQQLQQRMTPQQQADFQANHKDPVLWYFQNQAFNILAKGQNARNANGQAGQPSQNNPQAAMMQQQHSQQSLQRQNMMSAVQGDGSGNDFSQFNHNMESIKDQQMSGLIAQQQGQPVVPASNSNGRHATPQPLNQGMPQQGPSQAPRQPQQLPAQQTPQQQQQQQQAAQHLRLQQMKMSQGLQQSPAQVQNQVQAQMNQMQGQQGAMGPGVPPSQSPAMDTLNTPGSRPTNNMNPMMGQQSTKQGGVQFGDQRFNQGIQRPNSQAFQQMLSNMSQEHREALAGLPPDKLTDVMKKWQATRQEHAGMNGGQMNMGQMQNRPQNQSPMGQMNPSMAGLGPQGMQQPGMMGNGNPQQQIQQIQQMLRMPPNPQTQAIMDSMDLPPQVTSHLSHLGPLPPDVKKWKDLKQWLSRNNSLDQPTRNQLGALQTRQFQMFMTRRATMIQQQQNANMMGNSMQSPAGQMPNQQQNPMQRRMGNMGNMANMSNPMANPMANSMGNNMGGNMGGNNNMGNNMGGNLGNNNLGNIPNMPPSIGQVTPHEMMQTRASRPNLMQLPDEQVRAMIVQMKKATWVQQQQQQQQMRALQVQQTQPMVQGQQQNGQNQVSMSPGFVPPQQQPGQMHQAAQSHQAMQANTPKQQATTPRMPATNNRNQAPNPSPAQVPKSLKRATPDDESEAPKPPAATQQPTTQQMQKPFPSLTPQQIASMTPEQRAKFEHFRMAQANSQSNLQNSAQANAQAKSAKAMNRLKTIGQEEQKQVASESMPDIIMSPQEQADTANKLQRIAIDMGKVSRGLRSWYQLTEDDARARQFFRARWRILKQFVDGENMTVLKDTFSIRCAELDQARGMLESIAKDLHSVMTSRMKSAGAMQQQSQQPGAPQGSGAQFIGNQQGQAQQAQSSPQVQTQVQQSQARPHSQSQPGQSVPLNAANLEKNAQALNKSNSQKGKTAQSQVPAAPTASQPPFSFGGSSPHGNPNYMGKPKDINLQLPPRKKTKMGGQQGGPSAQGATPSPQISKMPSSDLRRSSEPLVPPKPTFLCKEPECASVSTGFPTEQALHQHIDEEHVKPKEDPINFVKENLALALGLEPDGTVRKQQKSGDTIQEASAMKRSESSMSKGQEKKTDATKAGDKTQNGFALATAPVDAWAGCTIDPQALTNNLGYDPITVPGLASTTQTWRALTPKDTPDSVKDSGSSEPNSDISENMALDIDLAWQHIGPDLLYDFSNASIEGDDFGGLDSTFDAESLLDPPRPLPDWNEVKVDFSKPFQMDTSYYFMDTDTS